jgi:UDP-GlcNAc:undecaprenyl-phosphate GlcNAc-1-phosphate transferase
MNLSIYLIIFLSSLFISILLTKIVQKIALSFSILDIPNHRKNHPHPIPLLGGVAIFSSLGLVVTLALIFFFFAGSLFLNKEPHFLKIAFPKLISIGVSSMLILSLGTWDDLRTLPWWIKLVFQTVAALIVVLSGIRLEVIPHPFLSSVVTIIWIVGITNSFNFLDNMDGIASGVAFIASLFFFIIAATQGQYLVASLILAFSGVLLGFLFFNFPPAKIFMGDGGSLFLGFFLSTLAVTSSYLKPDSEEFLPLVAPILIFGVPIFDTTTVVYTRIRNKKPFYVGDTNHFTHRLAEIGFNKPQVAFFVYLVCLTTGCAALLLVNLTFKNALILLVQEFSIFVIIILLMKFGSKNNPNH